MLNELFQGIINTSLAVSAIILLVMLLLPLLHKFYRARVNCLIWAIIAIRLLIPALPENPPAIAIPLDREMEFFWQQEEDIGEMPQMNQEHPVQTVRTEQSVQFKSKLDEISPFTLLAAVWLAGTVLFFLHGMESYVRTRKRLLRWSVTIQDKQVCGILEECKKELGIRRNIALYQCSVLNTPILMGFFSPRILLPDVALTEKQIRCILLHELTHYRRRDLWMKLLVMTAGSVHWFNPLVWLMGKKAEEDIETACDAAVLHKSSGAERREYGAVILFFIQANHHTHIPLTTNFFENRHQIVRRFEKIMETKKKHNGTLCTALVLAAAIGSMTLVGFVDVQAANAKPAAVPENGVTVVSKDAAKTRQEQEELYRKDKKAYEAQQEDFQKRVLAVYDSSSADLQAVQMVWPAPGYYNIRMPYGFRYDGTDFHVGIDIADFLENDPDGQEIFGKDVVAAQDGTVVHVQTEYTPGRGYGLCVILDHGDHLSTLYGQLSKITVEEGDAVKAGQKIGEIGSTGFSTGPHLHFEVREAGQAVDPGAYLLPDDAE